MHVVVRENILPDLGVGAVEQVARLGSEHGVFIGDRDEFQVVLALLICDEGQVRVTLLAVLANDQSIILIILLEEAFWVIVA